MTSPEKFSIFFAIGQSIRGISRKGKEFVRHDTSHAEDIRQLFVKSSHIWSAGEYALSCYESAGGLNIIDKYHYTCEDQINDLVVAEVQG